MAATILIFLLMIHVVSSADQGVNYRPSHICALKHSSVTFYCTYTYPTGHKIKKVFWTKTPVKDGSKESSEEGEHHKDLSEDPEYSQRLQYLGDKQKNCTIRLSHVTQKDSHMYCFRFITDDDDDDDDSQEQTSDPGVTLTVTDLQVESPETVKEGHNVSLTCKSSCALTDRATFIWYRNSQPLTERRDRNNQLLLQSVRREDAGRYSCGVQGHTYISPAVQLNVTYPPKNVSVSISPSGEIVEGDSVTLICSSDSNPPAEISWFQENQISSVGSGQSFSALQSGRFYCEAHNQHGSQRSDAVTVTVKVLYWKMSQTAIVVPLCGIVAAVIIGLLTCCVKRNILQSESLKNNYDDIGTISDSSLFSYVYENVAVHPYSKTLDPKINIPLYENVTIYENLPIPNRNML